MKKMWFVAPMATLALLVFFAVPAMTEQLPAPASGPQIATPATESDILAVEKLAGEEEVAASSLNSCSVTTVCPDGCVVACGGTNSCSRTSFSVTCDGRTYTCSGPRLCPF